MSSHGKSQGVHNHDTLAIPRPIPHNRKSNLTRFIKVLCNTCYPHNIVNMISAGTLYIRVVYTSV